MAVGEDLWTEMQARYNRGDLSGATSLYASEVVYVDPLGRYEGPEAVLASWEAGDTAFPGARMQTSRRLEEGDTLVAAEYNWRAAHTGAFDLPDGSQLPASGNNVEYSGLTILTVRDAKFASQRDYFDSAVVMAQMGLMPGAWHRPGRTQIVRVER